MRRPERSGRPRRRTTTRLVTVAHGTRHASGNEVAAEITRRAGAALGLAAQVSYVELCEPSLTEVVTGSAAPTLVVPLLLSTGYHTRTDLPAAIAQAPGPVELAPTLGPDPLLAAAQVDRLVAAGAAPGQPVVMVAAGSRDPAASADLRTAVDLLAAHWQAPVRLATLAGLGERVEEVVRPGDAVSPYLLAPGFFSRRAATLSRLAGATAVALPFGVHPLVVQLVVARAGAVLAGPVGVEAAG